jgi:hypothetical protein
LRAAVAIGSFGRFTGSLQEHGQPIRGQERVRLRVVVLFAADEAAVPGQQVREDHGLQAAAEWIVGEALHSQKTGERLELNERTSRHNAAPDRCSLVAMW